MHTGPKLTNNNLVFGYDTGYGIADNETSTRFYPGMPTTNLNADPYHSTKSAGDTVTLSAWGGDTGQGSFEVNTSPAGGGMMFINHNTSDPAGTGGTFTDFPSTRYTLTNGVTYTRSWWAKADDNRSVSAHICSCNRDSTNTYIVGPSITLSPTWQRYSSTFNYTGATSSDWQFRHIIYDASKVYIANVQLEVGSIASPPLIGTRSDTASLIDLKKTTDIDVSSVSFNSTGQPEFDGTDDYFTTSGLSGVNSQVLTFEKVIRFNGTLDTNDRKIFHWDKTGTTNGVAQVRKGSGNSILMYQHHNGSQWYTLSVDNVVVADTFMHIVVVHSGTTATMYKNGVQVGTATVGVLNYTDAAEILVGYRANSEYWKGNIPVFKVYDQALTLTEVVSNFNAYKNRFDIQ